jgi:hypothetical protein
MIEGRLIIATVAQRWQFSLEPNQEVTPVQLVTLRPKNGIRMKVRAAQILEGLPCAS